MHVEKAWFIDDDQSNQRSQHHLNPPQFVDMEQLAQLTGVQYYKMTNEERIKKGLNLFDKPMTREDTLTISDNVGNADAYFFEHMHVDEEVRYVLEGSAFFDLCDKNDKWIRFKFEKDDLLIIPGGCYHRLTLDSKGFCKLARYYSAEPVWKAYTRMQAENLDSRKTYVSKLQGV